MACDVLTHTQRRGAAPSWSDFAELILTPKGVYPSYPLIPATPCNPLISADHKLRLGVSSVRTHGICIM